MTNAFPTVKLFGFDFSKAETITEVASHILSNHDVPGCRFLITPNASILVCYNEKKHKALKASYKNAEYILPDGMPIVWLSRLKGKRIYRLPGSELFPVLWKQLVESQIPVVCVVANESLAEKLQTEHKGCRCIVPRFFQATEEDYIKELSAEIVSVVKETKAKYVFIGLTSPKQEKLALEIKKVIGVDKEFSVLVLMLGASFEFYFGLKARAPLWMQRNGLEWLHRFIKEPRRLWKRYTVDNFRFLLLALRELLISGK